MEREETEIRSLLLDRDETFRQLVEKHTAAEAKLEELTSKRPFTERDHYHEVNLKKQKLLLKDRMTEIVRDFLQGQRQEVTAGS